MTLLPIECDREQPRAHDLHFAQPFNTLSCPGSIDNPLHRALADYSRSPFSPLAKRSRHERSPERSQKRAFVSEPADLPSRARARARPASDDAKRTAELEAARGIPMRRIAQRVCALARSENRSVNSAIALSFARSQPINAD